MNSDRSFLLFPLMLTRLRKSRGLLQKTAALDLGIDPTVLCAIEKGTRTPLDNSQINKLVDVFRLSEEEAIHLRWAAHHDRLVGHLESRGATSTEVAFISTALHALRHLQPQQISGLIASLQQIDKSASLVASLGKSNLLMEVAMS
jgi:transcriptional regulator with XRE-family HTH domain